MKLYLFYLPTGACIIIANSQEEALQLCEVAYHWRPLEFSSPDINGGQRSTFYPIEEYELEVGLNIPITVHHGPKAVVVRGRDET